MTFEGSTAISMLFLRSAVAWLSLTVSLTAQSQTTYEPVKQRLSEAILRELVQKKIPAAYVALIDNQETVWAAAFGYSDPDRKLAATPHNVHRIASVSKLFTDIAAMQLVERGLLDLDSPVNRILPHFQPRNNFGKDITLRQLMSHRSGLVREPPVGNYFDPNEPALAGTVASLNETEIVYEPGIRVKYSNAAIAVVGAVVEQVSHTLFAEHVQNTVLAPLGMHNSSFTPRPDLLKRKPRAFLWTYDGRRFDAPTFQFGMAPAANMYSTIGDLGEFLKALFNDGVGAQGRILTRESLEEMWRPQFTPSPQKSGIGLGFFVNEFDGARRVGHSGDVYGFATEFSALPDHKLGVVVINTMNACNAWSSRVADYALQLMMSHRSRKPLPAFESTEPVDTSVINRVRGKYRKGSFIVEFFPRGGNLMMLGPTMQLAVRQREGRFIVDDRISYGTVISFLDDAVVIGLDTLGRIPYSRPESVVSEWEGLIGEYGWDHNTLYIHERNGVLHAQIEWYFSYPLTRRSQDVYDFPNFGLYHGEQLIFRRDTHGRATEVVAAGVTFKRRSLGQADDTPFRIKPRKSFSVLQQEALRISPPVEQGDFLNRDLVDATSVDSTIKLDIRYATTNNFMNAVFYSHPRALLQRPAAEALGRATRWLRHYGYGLLIYDAYRPWYVTKMFWEATPDHLRDFVADPSTGSRHNRGCAVDVSLYDLKTGAPAPMVSGYDEFSPRAYPDYPGETSLRRWNRDLLRSAMEAHGFKVFDYEWWHFDFDGWERYRIMNFPFELVP